MEGKEREVGRGGGSRPPLLPKREKADVEGEEGPSLGGSRRCARGQAGAVGSEVVVRGLTCLQREGGGRGGWPFGTYTR